jgi:glycosyltransferase involved in cell wall biosynthesis
VTGRRIALLHFTAPPIIGGVEALLAAQAKVLTENGYQVTVVAGAGEPSGRYQLEIVPLLDPDAPAIRAGRAGSAAEAHCLTRQIMADLLLVLSRQDEVWVHNALTVYLNPFLTAALESIMRELRGIRWVVFCHDLSAISAYWDAGQASLACLPVDMHGVRYVVLSPSRRAELARFLGINESAIDVISPPLDVLDWLDIGHEAREIVRGTRLPSRDCAVLVPAKLLPHKRMDRLVGTLAILKRSGLDPLGLITGAPSPHEPGVSARIRTELGEMVRREGLEGHVVLLTEMLGHVPSRATVRDLMSLCDLVYLPSHEEGYGTPISEAIALRVPVLCSDIPAFRHAAGSYATYVAGGDVDATAEHMQTIVSGPVATQRREVVQSMGRFCMAVLSLAGEVSH